MNKLAVFTKKKGIERGWARARALGVRGGDFSILKVIMNKPRGVLERSKEIIRLVSTFVICKNHLGVVARPVSPCEFTRRERILDSNSCLQSHSVHAAF